MNGRRRCAIDFYSKEAYDAYMKQHPKADPKNHRVLPKEEQTKSGFEDRDNIMQGQKSLVESNVKGLIAGMVGVNADDIGIAESKTLLFTDEEHNSNKFHQFNIMQLPNGNYLVTDSYGRVGSAGKPQILSAQIKSLDDAKEVLGKLVSGKERQGYKGFDAEVNDESGQPSSPAAQEKKEEPSKQEKKEEPKKEHPVFNQSFIDKYKSGKASIRSSWRSPSEFNTEINNNGGWGAIPRPIADSIWKELGPQLDSDQRNNLLYSNASDDTKMQCIKTSGDKLTKEDIMRFARSEKCPDSLVDFFARGRNSTFKAEALRNPKCKPEHIKAGATDRYDFVREAAAESPICDDEMAKHVIQNHMPGYGALNAIFSDNQVSAQVKNEGLRKLMAGIPYVSQYSSSAERGMNSKCRYQVEKAAKHMISNGLLDEETADILYDVCQRRGVSVSSMKGKLMDMMSAKKIGSMFAHASLDYESIDPNESDYSRRQSRKYAADSIESCLRSAKMSKDASLAFMERHQEFVDSGFSNPVFTDDDMKRIVSGSDPRFTKYPKRCALAAIMNPNTSAETLSEIVGKIDSYTVHSSSDSNGISANGELSESSRRTHANVIAPFISKNTNLSDSDVNKVLDFLEKSSSGDETQMPDEERGYGQTTSRNYAMRRFLRNPNISSGTLNRVLDGCYGKSFIVACGSPAMDLKAAEYISRNSSLCAPLASNPRTPQSVNDANINEVAEAIMFFADTAAKYGGSYYGADKPSKMPPSVERAYDRRHERLYSGYGSNWHHDDSCRGNIAKFITPDTKVSSKALERLTDAYTKTRGVASVIGSLHIRNIIGNPSATDKVLSNLRTYAVRNRIPDAVDAIDAVSARRSRSDANSIDLSKMSPELRERVKDMDQEELRKFIAWLASR